MRIIVFFDLPTETPEERREYRKFRKLLIDHGFLMMQESVYCKLLLTPSMENTILEVIRKQKPSGGIVQALTITEKQFSRIEYMVGTKKTETIDSDERLIIL